MRGTPGDPQGEPPRHLLPSTPAEALQFKTRPLIDVDRRLIVLISPKSACSSALIWFYKVSGQYEAARRYHAWPHRYRTQVLDAGEQFRRALDLGLDQFQVVRIVRDPYARAISSFRHALATGYARPALARVLGIPGQGPLTLSLSDFLDFLERLDLRIADTHHALQYHPIERWVRPRWIIDVTRQNLYAELNGVESAMGLPQTDFAHLDWLQQLHGKRDFHHRQPLERADTMPLTPAAARQGPWPADASLLTTATRGRIRRLYDADFRAYGFAAGPAGH